jgi:hypothetical protein
MAEEILMIRRDHHREDRLAHLVNAKLHLPPSIKALS